MSRKYNARRGRSSGKELDRLLCFPVEFHCITVSLYFTFETVKFYGANKRRSLPDGVDKLNFVYTKVNLAGTEAAGDVRSFMHVTRVQKKMRLEAGA